MRSPHDTAIDIASATRIFTATKQPKSFVCLEHADHLLRERADAIYAAT
jgi:putative redox protein